MSIHCEMTVDQAIRLWAFEHAADRLRGFPLGDILQASEAVAVYINIGLTIDPSSELPSQSRPQSPLGGCCSDEEAHSASQAALSSEQTPQQSSSPVLPSSSTPVSGLDTETLGAEPGADNSAASGEG